MAKLKRNHYLAIFRYAASSYKFTRSEQVKSNMRNIMNAVEEAIGPQPDRPDKIRFADWHKWLNTIHNGGRS